MEALLKLSLPSISACITVSRALRQQQWCSQRLPPLCDMSALGHRLAEVGEEDCYSQHCLPFFLGSAETRPWQAQMTRAGVLTKWGLLSAKQHLCPFERVV